MSILDISKIAMYKYWYDYVQPKSEKKAKQCYMDTDSFIVNVKSEDIYDDLAGDIKTRFDTSYYEVKRPLPNGKNKRIELC